MILSARGREIAILEALGETGWWLVSFFDHGPRAAVHATDIEITSHTFQET